MVGIVTDELAQIEGKLTNSRQAQTGCCQEVFTLLRVWTDQHFCFVTVIDVS